MLNNRVNSFIDYCKDCVPSCLIFGTKQSQSRKFGDFCLSCYWEEAEKLKKIFREKVSTTKIPGSIEKVKRFQILPQFRWSNNLVIIITFYDEKYWVFLAIVDRSPNAIGKVQSSEIFTYPSNLYETKWGIGRKREGHSDILFGAESEAGWLEEAIMSSPNPILCIHPKVSEYVKFEEIVTYPYVIRTDISLKKWNSRNNNLLGETSDSETRELEKIYEVQETPLKTSDCVVM